MVKAAVMKMPKTLTVMQFPAALLHATYPARSFRAILPTSTPRMASNSAPHSNLPILKSYNLALQAMGGILPCAWKIWKSMPLARSTTHWSPTGSSPLA
eukprot:5932332-Alexandrium_andersonii.AAC.1